ncbi:MAG: hypothetical protein K8953_08830, partial [Proteobacteria bacterium]|nr:hypothetical protein [Pseudomonadota bacterium]
GNRRCGKSTAPIRGNNGKVSGNLKARVIGALYAVYSDKTRRVSNAIKITHPVQRLTPPNL